MRDRSGHVAVGVVSGAMGAIALMLAIIRPPFLMGSFLDTPLWAVAFACGVALLLVGPLIAFFAVRTVEQASPAIPAHVAFNSKMAAPDLVPELGARPTAAGITRTSGPAPRPTTPSRIPPNTKTTTTETAPLTAATPTTPNTPDDLATIDNQIRELTRRINKAGVMLATGQLSQQGYLEYVEGVKQERGRLEAARVRAELKS